MEVRLLGEFREQHMRTSAWNLPFAAAGGGGNRIYDGHKVFVALRVAEAATVVAK